MNGIMSDPEKVIIVTRATSDLGSAMVKEFLALGHKVVGCGRSEAKIRELKQKYSPISDRCEFAVVDVCRDDQVRQWTKQILKKFGAPDFIIYKAGVTLPPNKLWEIPAAVFDRVLDGNTKGLANVVRHFVPSMIRAKRGVVVNVTSYLGRNKVPTMAPYSDTKWDLEGFSRTLAAELPECLTSIQLDPGAFATPITRIDCDPEEYENLITAEGWARKVCPFVLTVDRSLNGKVLDASLLDVLCGLHEDRESPV